MRLSKALGAAARLALVIGGESMQSGLHFALSLALMRVLPARDYGVFAIIMVIGGVGLTYVRSLTALPASIFIGRSRSAEQTRFYEGVFNAAAVALSTAIALVVGAILCFLQPDAAVAGAIFVGLWCLRSHARTVHFAFRRRKLVTTGDLVFALSGGAVVILILWRGEAQMTEVFFGAAVANMLATMAMQALARQPLKIDFGQRSRTFYISNLRRLGWSAFSVTTTNLQGQGVSLLFVGLAGPAAYAPIAAILVIFVPLRIAATAVVNLIQPEMAMSAAKADVREILALARFWTAVLGSLALIYGAAAMLAVPFIKSQSLEGAPVYLIGAFAWTIQSLTLLYVAPRVILEVHMKFYVVALITTVAAVVGIGTAAVLLGVAPVSWALAGSALGEAIVLATTWFAALDLLGMRAARKGGFPSRGVGALPR
jgi:hypothetical protein